MKQLILIPLVACTLWLQPSLFGKEPERKVTGQLYPTSLFDALDHHSSVYIGHIKTRTPLVSDDVWEGGSVVLAIDRTIIGTPQKDVTLPYVFPDEDHVRPGSFSIWPDLRRSEGKSLVFVVTPNGLNDMAPIVEGVTDAASMVYIVSGNDDPKVAALEAACILYASLGKKGDLERLEKAYEDTRWEVRQLALEATISRLGSTSPATALELLRKFAGQTDDKTNGSRVSIVGYITSKVSLGETSPDMQKFLVRALVAMLSDPSKNIKRHAVEGISYFIRHRVAFGSEPKLNEILSAQELQELQVALDDLKGLPSEQATEVFRVRDYLTR